MNAASVNTPSAEIESMFRLQQNRHYDIARIPVGERIRQLRRLHDTVLKYREEIRAALWADFRKGPAEVDISEIICINSELRHLIRNLRQWLHPATVPVRLPLFTSSASIRQEPKGVCLIISPWNFPFNLSLIPLGCAVAAGNSVILKPSEHAPHSAALLKKILAECFPPEQVSVAEGDVEVARQLLELPFHHIFFTGSPAVGKIVMAAAAKHLSSVTLELGGKSPVIVDETADIDRAASRIIWLKCMNAGQTCIAPDFILVHEKVYSQLLDRMEHYLVRFYGDDPRARKNNPDLPVLIHARHFERAMDLLNDAMERGAKRVFGGEHDASLRYVDPTILTDVPAGALIWEEEIFCPILPVQKFENLTEAIQIVQSRPKPLATYIFSNRQKNIDEILNETRGGGVSINECGLQFFNPDLPFGGHNNSGIGYSHGRHGFNEFSNFRGIARQSRWATTTFLFLPPYKGKLFQWLLAQLSRWL